MMNFLKRYKVFIFLLIINIVITVFFPKVGLKSVRLTINNTLEMLFVIPPIFIMLGLLDVWVERETMIKLIGEKSGIIGVVIAFLLGSVAAGPLYAAFPVAGVFLKKGCKFTNVLIFIGAWSTTKIPMLLFEASSMGVAFMIVRFLINIPGIALIAYATEKLMNQKDYELIYRNINDMD